MPDAPSAVPPRRSRFWLFAPFVILGLVVAAWTTAWVMIRDETTRVLDDWIASESAAGRQWLCRNRSVGGYPFRIELTCEALSLQSPDLRLTLGPMTAVAQVYRPRHVIAEVAGPLRVGEGPVAVDGTWRLLEASIRTTRDGLQRLSVAIDRPTLRLSGLAPGDLDFAAEHIETHLRPNPTRVSEGAYDWALQATKLTMPGIDAMLGGNEPADVDLDITATQLGDVAARPLREELERWRQTGGRIDIPHFALAKGGRRLEAKGQFGLDEAHRPQGQATLAATGLEGLLGTVLGARAGATAALLGALTGKTVSPAPVPSPAAPGTSPGLKPLPPLRIEGGRIQLGALPIPGIRVAPLY